MRILMILPAYNEEKNIVSAADQIRNCRFSEGIYVDIIVINDGSKDKTEKVCRDNGIPCISLVHNLGIGGAVQTGYIFAAMQDYDIAVQFDGDGQHDIHSLETLIKPIVDGEADFTVGSRFVDKSASGFQSRAMRQFGIKLLSGLLKLLTGEKILDITSGYRAAGKNAIEIFAREYAQDYPEPESLIVLHKRGLRIKECPVNMFERENGKSSIGTLSSAYYMLKVTLAMIFRALQRG